MNFFKGCMWAILFELILIGVGLLICYSIKEIMWIFMDIIMKGQTDLFRQRILTEEEQQEWFKKFLEILGD